MSNEELDSKTNEELHQMLTEREVEGRSSMNREEMIAALRSGESTADTSRRNTSQDASPKQRGSRADVGQKEVTEAFVEANAQGYFGTTQDETPNEHYTVAGVTAGKPTPETESRGERRAIPDADARDRR